MTPTDSSLVEFATEVAREAGQLTLGWFQSDTLHVDHKFDGSPVTAADLAAETLIRQRIAAAFPDDSIMGEEHTDSVGRSGRTWVIDPIDGTKAFTHGVPLYSNLIALIDEQGPAVGVINLPGLNETIAAGRGLGCTRNDQPCSVSSQSSLGGAYLCTSGFGYWPSGSLTRALRSDASLRTWGDAYGYALVATGRAEAMIDPEVNPWDVAPMAVIIAEAGGSFTTIDNKRDWNAGSGLATNGLLHDQVLGFFAES